MELAENVAGSDSEFCTRNWCMHAPPKDSLPAAAGPMAIEPSDPTRAVASILHTTESVGRAKKGSAKKNTTLAYDSKNRPNKQQTPMTRRAADNIPYTH